MSKDKSTNAPIVETTDVEVVETENVEESKNSNSWNFEPAIDMMEDYMKLSTKKDKDGKTLFDILIPLDHKGIRQHFKLDIDSVLLSYILRDALGNMFYRGGNKKAVKRFNLNQVPTMSFHAKSKARKTQAEKDAEALIPILLPSAELPIFNTTIMQSIKDNQSNIYKYIILIKPDWEVKPLAKISK